MICVFVQGASRHNVEKYSSLYFPIILLFIYLSLIVSGAMCIFVTGAQICHLMTVLSNSFHVGFTSYRVMNSSLLCLSSVHCDLLFWEQYFFITQLLGPIHGLLVVNFLPYCYFTWIVYIFVHWTMPTSVAFHSTFWNPLRCYKMSVWTDFG